MSTGSLGGMIRRLTLAFAAFAASYPLMADAQDTPPTAWARGYDINGAASSSAVAWFGAWSPLRPIVDLPRGMLRAPLAPGLLDTPAPMAGAFVLSGAPGALARDLVPRLPGDTARFGELRLRKASDAGDYRRPLDLARSNVTQLSSAGWSPVGTRGIVAGRAVIDREDTDNSSYSEMLTPYRSNPFVDTDSVTPPMRRTRARFEGALGLRLGGFGLGIAAGVESREQSTIAFPLRRGGRAATPAISAGAERVLPWLRGRIGGYYRWSEPTETYVLNVNPLTTTMYAITGFDEPSGVPVTSLPILARADRHATAVGGTAEIELVATRIVLTHERGERAENQYRSITTAVRPTDRWRASGNETRMLLQRPFGSRIRATVIGSSESLDGTAVRQDLAGVSFIAHDSRMAIEADVRLQLSEPMQLALIGGATRLSSARSDFVAPLKSDVANTTPFGAAEIARRWGRTAVSTGVSFAFTSPSGSVPLAEREANYRRLIAPMLAYESAEARAVAMWVTAGTPIRGAMVLASLRSERTTPVTVVTRRLQPEGDRTGWSMVISLR